MCKQVNFEERTQQILQHLPQIKYIAREIACRLPASVQLDDLVNTGVLGLSDALEKFDKGRGVQFKTYAEFRIRGAILDSLRSLDWVPHSLRQRARRIREARSRLEQRLGRSASETEVAEELGVDVDSFRTSLPRLEALNPDDQSVPWLFWGTPNPRSVAPKYPLMSEQDSPFEAAHKRELSVILAKMISALPEKERRVITLHYYRELTMKEISTILHVNASRVSQLHTSAMSRMRKKLQAVLKSRKSNWSRDREGAVSVPGPQTAR